MAIKKKLLKVLLSDENDIVLGYYNRSNILWEDLNLKLGKDIVEKLGLYAPYYYTNDPHNAKYIQSYTIGDLINFLHYSYYYQSIETSKNCHELKFEGYYLDDPVDGESYNAGDYDDDVICDWGIAKDPEKKEDNIVLYKTCINEEYPDKIVDYGDQFFYRGVVTVDGEEYDSWQKFEYGKVFLFDDSRKKFALTKRIVFNGKVNASFHNALKSEHERIYVHRYITIYMESIDYASKNVIGRLEASNTGDAISNDRSNYVWKVKLGDVVIGVDTELVEALYKAVKVIYFDRPLYKIPLSELPEKESYNKRHSGIAKQINEKEETLIETNFDTVHNIIDNLDSAVKSILNIQPCRYRNKHALNSDTNAEYVDVYDIGDLINLLGCNYYTKIVTGYENRPEYNTGYTKEYKTQDIFYNRIISFAPVHKDMLGSKDNYKGKRFDFTHTNNFDDYIWVVKAGADILGYNTDLAEAMSEAVIDIYDKKKWYNIVVDEYKIADEVETEIEFSLTDV